MLSGVKLFWQLQAASILNQDWQFRSLQLRTTESLDVTIVDITKVVTSLPGSVELIDVVDHLAGQWLEAGSGQAH